MVQFLALTKVSGEGHDLAVMVILQPLEDDGGIQATGIGQNDFTGFAHRGNDIGSEYFLARLQACKRVTGGRL